MGQATDAVAAFVGDYMAERVFRIGTRIIHKPSGLKGKIVSLRRRKDGTLSGLPYVIEWDNLAAALVKIGNAVGVENMAVHDDLRKEA